MFSKLNNGQEGDCIDVSQCRHSAKVEEASKGVKVHKDANEEKKIVSEIE